MDDPNKIILFLRQSVSILRQFCQLPPPFTTVVNSFMLL